MRKLITTLSLVALLILGAGAAQADWEAGVAAFKAGNFAEAINQFKAVVEAQPEYAGGHLMLGNAYLKANQPKQAVPQLQKALELNQGDAQTTVLYMAFTFLIAFGVFLCVIMYRAYIDRKFD